MDAAGALSWHETFGWIMIGTNAIAGAWALAAHRWSNLGGRPLWSVIVVAQALVFVQAVLGVLLTTRFEFELDDFHALYGFSAIIAVGILYSYRTSTFMRGKVLLLYGFGSLFIMGLGLRNLTL